MDLYHQTLKNAFIVMFLCMVFSFDGVDGQIELCTDVYAPFLQPENVGNCSLVCTLKLQNNESKVHDEELALCIKNSSIAVLCTTHFDCLQYHVRAYCKMIPCFCKNSCRSEYYILDSFEVPRLKTCVLSTRYSIHDLNIHPSIWRTMSIGFTFALTFMLCFSGFKWASSRLKKWQVMRLRGETRRRSFEYNATLFSSPLNNSHVQLGRAIPITSSPRGVIRIYGAGPRSSQHRNRPVPRTYYTETSLSNQDQPPSYEAVAQTLPPTYEDAERARNEEQRNEVHVPPH